MAYTEFYINQNAGSSNLNSGSTCSDVGGLLDTPIYTCTNGGFDGTSIFTPADGSNPASSGVAVGMYISLNVNTDTRARCIAQITNVAAGVNGAITVSTTIKWGVVPTVSGTLRTCYVGGALASFDILGANGALAAGTVPQSTRINVKAATYANGTTSRGINQAGTATALCWWRGYKTTPGDQDANNLAVAGTDIPAITFTTAANFAITSARVIFSNFDISASTANNLMVVNGGQCVVYGCRFENTSANAAATAVFIGTVGNVFFIRCYIKAPTTATQAANIQVNGVDFLGCQIVGGAIGLLSVGQMRLVNCIIDSPSGDGIRSTATLAFISRCSLYGAGGSSGNAINFTTVPSASGVIINCYFENWLGASKAAINNTSGTNSDLVRVIDNAYFNVTAARAGITEDFTMFDNGILASAGFVNPGSQNFTMNAIGQNIGFPGLFEKATAYQGYADVGAVQHQGAAGGAAPIFQVEA